MSQHIHIDGSSPVVAHLHTHVGLDSRRNGQAREPNTAPEEVNALQLQLRTGDGLLDVFQQVLTHFLLLLQRRDSVAITTCNTADGVH